MKTQREIAGLVVACYLAQLLVVPLLWANPTGPSVVAGEAAISGLNSSKVTILQGSQRAIINWQSFNIAPHEVTQFIQPNVRAIALNRIFDQNPSQIFGRLQANGTVILLNKNGVMFGPNAQVNVGGLVASSLSISNANFLAGHYLYEGAGLEGWVKNAGTIHGHYDGVYLLAPNVENSGIVTSPGGTILLAAGKTAYLSNRPDGQGFLAELKAPVGQAVNLKSLIADSGHITLAGQVVNQQGLVQANSVRERQGKIEIYAGEKLTLAVGSRTLAQGGSDGLSQGGTILAVADKTKGTANFEKGATLDVSGGANGGHAGFVELSGKHVSVGGRFIGTARTGYRGGRLLIDPVDLDLTGFAATNFQDIAFSSLIGEDLRVTGVFDLNLVQPPTGGGTIRFTAGRDLLFTDVLLWNNPLGTSAKWDIVGAAERHILFKGFIGSTIATAHGGSIDLQAKTGEVNLIDPGTGSLATLRVDGGGGISIKTGQDLVASTVFDESGGLSGLFNSAGIHIEGSGRLNLDVGRNFIGGPAKGVASGPGFVVRNEDTAVAPQHSVKVAGQIGETNLALEANGLPKSQQAESERSNRYADFALSGGQLTVEAGGNIYLNRVRDAGLVGGLDLATGTFRSPQFSPGLENNKATIVSRNGHILLNTSPVDAGRQNVGAETLGRLLPASFEARADNGTIQIRSDLAFLPSPTGAVKFFAKQDIQGVPKRGKGVDPNFIWLYVGYGGVSGGQWVAVDKRTIPQRPDLWPFVSNTEESPSLPPRPPSDQAPPNDFPSYAMVDVDLNPPTVKLLEANPKDLIGEKPLNELESLVKGEGLLPPDNLTALAPVSFKAELGNISRLALDLVSRPFRKEVSIEAGNKIEQFNASIYLPDLGTQTQTVTERIPLFIDPVTNQPRAIKSTTEILGTDVILIRDPVTGQVRPWDKIEAVNPANLVNVVLRDVPVTVTSPKAAATIKAQDIIFNKSAAGEGGVQFFGSGTAKVIATRNLDLADGRGIRLDPRKDKPNERGGFLDVAVGNNLDMVTTAIMSRNGAGVSIHGYDATKPYVVGYDNSALYPMEFPDSVRGGINLPAVGGKVNVGENNPRSQGGSGQPTGIQVLKGGSVGQKATEPVVNQDGTVTVNLVKDPAAILIRSKGDIDVNKSRIATFGGGDIRIASLQGNINAGSGSRDEQVLFTVETGEVDSQGNPIRATFNVPGSGIFTFHPDDPQPLVFPKFNDPEINALLAEASRERTFGRDVSHLEERANQLRAERESVFNDRVVSPFIDRLKLGDIDLTTEASRAALARGDLNSANGRIIIPEAGIRGRNLFLKGILDFRGGALVGRLPVGLIPPFTGAPNIPVLGGGIAPPLPPLSGGGAAAAASSTAAASSSSVKSSESVQESAAETSGHQAENKQVASKKSDNGGSQLARSVRVKRGVLIQVDVKPVAQQGG